MGGTCPGATILELDNFVQPPNVFQTVKGSWEHAAGSQYVDQAYIAVQYDGQLFFTNSKKSLLQLATDRGNVVLCQIKNELKKWHSPDVCQEFADNKFTSLENRLEKRKRAKDYVVDALPSMDIPYETDVDINNDGRPYKVYSVVYDSSAGCGGRSEFLSIGGNIPEKKYGLNVELRKLTKIDLGQEGHWSFIKIQGKNYLAKNAEFPSQASASEPLRQEEDFGDRVLYAAAGWHFEEICRLKPLTKKVFDTTESFK